MSHPFINNSELNLDLGNVLAYFFIHILFISLKMKVSPGGLANDIACHLSSN